ncbi:ADP-dependent glucokinase-like [Culicoides brevitarsis]|uniref:ADP-dependent glucokinase-like n=1 Tax=Culicoides brevitarsis TaxID=469753 RepID=UPI00307B1C7E
MGIISLVTTLSIFTAFSSVVYQAYVASNELKKVTSTISSLMYTENAINAEYLKKIAVGFGGYRNIYVKFTDFLNVTETHKNDHIKNLFASFASSFSRGQGSEYIVERQTFEYLVQKAQTIQEPVILMNVGAIGIATRLAEEQQSVLLAAKISKDLYTRLNPQIQLSEEDFAVEDNVCLILEYKKDEIWGSLKSSSANSFILFSECNIAEKGSIPKFSSIVQNFIPRLIIVTGLEVFKLNINSLQTQLKNLPNSTLIHLHIPIYVANKSFLDVILTFGNSLSMNEQSLYKLQKDLNIKDSTISTETANEITRNLDIIRIVFFNLYHRQTEKNTRKLSRIHVHSISFQIIMTVKSFGWRNTKHGIVKAALRAARHSCGTETLNPGSFFINKNNEFYKSYEPPLEKIKIRENEAVSCWTENMKINFELIELEFCVVVNLICRNTMQTSGLEENVLADALILQI